MIYFLVFIAGLLLACMQSFNGLLSNYIGTYGTSLIVSALLCCLFICLLKRKGFVFIQCLGICTAPGSSAWFWWLLPVSV